MWTAGLRGDKDQRPVSYRQSGPALSNGTARLQDDEMVLGARQAGNSEVERSVSVVEAEAFAVRAEGWLDDKLRRQVVDEIAFPLRPMMGSLL